MTPQRRLRELADPLRAKTSQWFFKTGPGDYGEGDRFLGLTVPQLRLVAREFRALPLAGLARLLRSPWHEERLLALVIASDRYKRGDSTERDALFLFYLDNLEWVNNWDLVDASAPVIIGGHLENAKRPLLLRLARSKSLWERRIAIVATQHFIRNGDLADTFRIAKMLLRDEQDLIHKATGWMLREAGKKDRAALEKFLSEHVAKMPRTMLRYAIERFPPALRKRFLAVESGHPARSRRASRPATGSAIRSL